MTDRSVRAAGVRWMCGVASGVLAASWRCGEAAVEALVQRSSVCVRAQAGPQQLCLVRHLFQAAAGAAGAASCEASAAWQMSCCCSASEGGDAACGGVSVSDGCSRPHGCAMKLLGRQASPCTYVCAALLLVGQSFVWHAHEHCRVQRGRCRMAGCVCPPEY